MNRLVVAAPLLAACHYFAPGGDNTMLPVDAAPPCTSFATLVDTCDLPPGSPLMLAGTLTFDTNTGDLFDGATPIDVETRTLTTPAGEIKAIVASEVTITANTSIRATGARAFGIVSGDFILLESDVLIDVGAGGAAARSSCTDPAMPGTARSGGAGGGGGGGFSGAGGNGGAGDKDGSTPSPGGLGGALVALPDGVIGGCPGAKGGDGENGGGPGGVGGGAVYFAAAGRIELAAGAVIDAGGDAGQGGSKSGAFSSGDAGGGGGGSGGMIVLEAPAISNAGTIAANGGGGGEASGNGSSGNDGQRGQRSTSRASGGSGNSSSGTDGGDGGAKFDNAGSTVGDLQNGGGGGGGGAAGYIRIIAPIQSLGALVSPLPN